MNVIYYYFRKRIYYLILLFLLKDVRCSDGELEIITGDLIDENSGRGGGGINNLIENKKKGKVSKDLQELKNLLRKQKYQFSNNINIQDENIVKKLLTNLKDGSFADKLKEFIKGPDKDKTKISLETQKKRFDDFIAGNEAMIDYINEDLTLAKEILTNVEELESKDETKDLGNMYRELLKNKDLMNMIKKTDKKYLRLLNTFFEKYKNVDKRERNVFEKHMEFFIKEAVEETQFYFILKKIRPFFPDAIEAKNKIIDPYVDLFTRDLTQLIDYLKEKDKETIKKFEKQGKESAKTVKEHIQGNLKDLDISGETLKKGISNKVEGCKMSCNNQQEVVLR